MPGRILIVVNRPEFFLSHRLPVAIGARAAGYDVHIATPRNEHVPGIEAAGFPWQEIPLSPGGQNILFELKTLAALFRLYRRLRPDLVHHVALKPVLYGTVAARFARVPSVVNALAGLGYTFSETGGLLGTAIRTALRVALHHPRMRVIFQNDDDRDLFVDHHWIGAREAVIIRGSGVDPAVFAPRNRPAEGRPLVMLASRLLFSKGIAEFIESARILRARGVDARFAIVGDVDIHNPDSVSRGDLESWKAEGLVEIWGPRNSFHEVIGDAAIFCLPTYYREGVPKVLIEAASAAIPIVTTDTPGCRDIVGDGENGLLVAPRNATAVADALEKLLKDPALREAMGQRGRDRVISSFSLESVVRATLAVYRDLLHA